jgi:hypothetical protein
VHTLYTSTHPNLAKVEIGNENEKNYSKYKERNTEISEAF